MARMKSMIAVLLAVMMAVVFTACGGSGGGGGSIDTTAAGETTVAEAAETTAAETTAAETTTEETTTEETTTEEPTTLSKEEAVIGSYTASLNMTEEMNTQLAETGIQFSGDIVMNMLLELKDDGTFILEADGKSFANSLATVFAEEGPAIIKDMLIEQGITEDQFDELAQQSGYDDFSAFMDDTVTEMTEQLGDEFVEQLQESAHTEGSYAISGDTMLLSADTGTDVLADVATINDDGTISIKSNLSDGSALDLLFVKDGAQPAKETETKAEETSTAATGTQSAEIAPGVLVDDDVVKIEFTGFGSSFMGQEFSLNIENKTDKSVSVLAQSFSANGVMLNAVLLAEAESGKSTTTGMSLYEEDLSKAGISSLEKDLVSVDWTFHVYDTESWETIEDVNVSMGDASYQAPEDDVSGKQVLLDDDTAQIVFESIEETTFGPEIKLTVRNRTDKKIIVGLSECSMNGKTVTPLFASELTAGKKAEAGITFFDYHLEDLGVEDFSKEGEEMELSFYIYDGENWSTIEEPTAVLKF